MSLLTVRQWPRDVRLYFTKLISRLRPTTIFWFLGKWKYEKRNCRAIVFMINNAMKNATAFTVNFHTSIEILYSLQNSISVYCSPIHCLGWFPAHDWQIKLIDGLLLHLEKPKKKTCTHWVPTFQLASTDGFISFERKKFFPSIFDYSSSKQTITKFLTQSRIFFCFKVVYIFRIQKLQFFLGWSRKE